MAARLPAGGRLYTLRLGIHTFTSGSLEKAALRAAELGANTFQIFSSSPRMWRARPLEPDQVRRMREVRERFDLRPLAIHAGYLINLAALDPATRALSIAAFREELERAAEIGAEYVVVHPGSYRGRSLEEGIHAFVGGLTEAGARFRSRTPTVLLENTAGGGCHIGSRFEELAAIAWLARDTAPFPIAYCLDTCHLLAAGFDIASGEGLRLTLAHASETLGFDRIRLIHANDSKTPLGSRLDRHANIGEGHIGLEAFRRILAHPRLRSKPFVLETPIDKPTDDRRNLDTLKSLAARPRTTVNRLMTR